MSSKVNVALIGFSNLETIKLEAILRLSRAIAIDFAHSGEEALACIRRDHTYDLIFLDIVMPGMDGYETCGLIRQEPRYRRKKPIIMLSSKSSPADQMRGFAVGCTNFLVKPIAHAEFQKMLNRVTSWLADRRASASA